VAPGQGEWEREVKVTRKRKVGTVDYSEVIGTIEHWLQYNGRRGVHPYESHEESARAMEPGDCQKALWEIGEALDRAKRSTGVTVQ
jgi:hypothetical protein